MSVGSFIRRKRKLLLIILMVIGLGGIAGGAYLVLNYNKDIEEGYEHLAEEEALADDYLAMLMQMKAAKQAEASAPAQPASSEAAMQQTPAETAEVPSSGDAGAEASAAPSEAQSPVQEVPTAAPEPAQPAPPTQPVQPAATVDTNYEDNLYRFSPEYAQGVIECVLEVPVAKIRRGVYTGAIEHDLDLWMVVAARDEYVLGQTHYCIYGHNSTKQDLSFNNLQPNCKLGDTFTLTNEDGAYEYTITNLFSENRNRVTKNYVDNFNIDKNLCYIITCGRNEHRYRDFVVEGTLTKFTPLEELIK
jgi:LPXTG-site transpeptidase (sortase) family protein